jgi:hypothetical protein
VFAVLLVAGPSDWISRKLSDWLRLRRWFILALTGLSSAPTFAVPNSGKLGSTADPVSMHGAAVGTARQLAGGGVCWVGSRDAHQHIGATPGVQAAQLHCMTQGDLHRTYSWNILAVSCVGSDMWNMISVGWLLAVLHESVGSYALMLPCRTSADMNEFFAVTDLRFLQQ